MFRSRMVSAATNSNLLLPHKGEGEHTEFAAPLCIDLTETRAPRLARFTAQCNVNPIQRPNATTAIQSPREVAPAARAVKGGRCPTLQRSTSRPKNK